MKLEKKITIDKYSKNFHDIKIYRYLPASEIKRGRKNLTKSKKVWSLTSFIVILIVLIMMILIIMMIIMVQLIMMNTKELDALEDYLKSLIEIITNQKELIMALVEEIIVT